MRCVCSCVDPTPFPCRGKSSNNIGNRPIVVRWLSPYHMITCPNGESKKQKAHGACKHDATQPQGKAEKGTILYLDFCPLSSPLSSHKQHQDVPQSYRPQFVLSDLLHSHPPPFNARYPQPLISPLTTHTSYTSIPKHRVRLIYSISKPVLCYNHAGPEHGRGEETQTEHFRIYVYPRAPPRHYHLQ